MSIGSFNPVASSNQPDDSDQVSAGAGEIRRVQADVKQSFPGFAAGLDIVATATGPEVEAAATGFAQLETDVATNTGDIATNTTDIGKNTAKLEDVVAIYSGRFLGNGTAVRLPTSWTVARDSLGTYTITHPLLVDLILTATSHEVGGATVLSVEITGQTTTSITLRVGGGVLVDAQVSFIAIAPQ